MVEAPWTKPVEVDSQEYVDEWGRTVAAAMQKAAQPKSKAGQSSVSGPTAKGSQPASVNGSAPDKGNSVTSSALIAPAASASAATGAAAVEAAAAKAAINNAVSKEDSFDVEVFVELPDDKKHEWGDDPVSSSSARVEASHKSDDGLITLKIFESDEASHWEEVDNEASDLEDSGEESEGDQEWSSDDSEDAVDSDAKVYDSVENYWINSDDDDDDDDDSDNEWDDDDDDSDDDDDKDDDEDESDDSSDDEEDAQSMEYERIYEKAVRKNTRLPLMQCLYWLGGTA